MPDAAAELDRLAGLVERVTFHNEQNGFCVLRLKVKGERVGLAKVQYS
jgi:exodeoxyribonuclease V alpha subunit